MNFGKIITMFLLGSMLISAAVSNASGLIAVPPNPVLFFTGTEQYTAGGKEWTRYKYSVENLAEYPDELFAPAPDLPPCGANTKSSRTWVDFYDSVGKRLYGFCALTKPSELGKLWFAVERDTVPPSWVYIELTDRRTNTKYKSNLADTVE